MNKEDIVNTVKKVQARKTKTMLMRVDLAYNKVYILPYNDGVKLIEALANAEQLIDEFGEAVSIQSIREQVKFCPFSVPEYERIKTATLLNVNVKEVPLGIFEE